MDNNGEVVSRISTAINALSKDSRLSKRYVLHVARKKSEAYISQKMSDRSLYREQNLYTTINCFPLEKLDVVKCDILEFRRCKSLMRSKHPLPKLIHSKYGTSVKEIYTVDGETEFSYTTPSQYRRNNNRSEKSDKVEFYIKDNYIYLVDSDIELIDVYLITTELEKIHEISECGDKDCECKSIFEYTFIVPDKMQEVVILESIKEISLKLGIQTDETPNLNSNEK